MQPLCEHSTTKPSNRATPAIQFGGVVSLRPREITLARTILRDLRSLKNDDPHAFQACVDRVLAGLREDNRDPKPPVATCKHGWNRSHWLAPASLGHCNGPDVITRYLETNRVTA